MAISMIFMLKDKITPKWRHECQPPLKNDCSEVNTSSTGWKYFSDMVSERYNRKMSKLFSVRKRDLK